jgi:hypothetical protein
MTMIPSLSLSGFAGYFLEKHQRTIFERGATDADLTMLDSESRGRIATLEAISSISAGTTCKAVLAGFTLRFR